MERAPPGLSRLGGQGRLVTTHTSREPRRLLIRRPRLHAIEYLNMRIAPRSGSTMLRPLPAGGGVIATIREATRQRSA